VIVINIEWYCNLDYSIDDCLPKYSFSRLDQQNAKIAKGSNFRCHLVFSLSISLSVCLSVSPSIHLSVCSSGLVKNLTFDGLSRNR